MEWYFFAIASAIVSALVPSLNKSILNDSRDALDFAIPFAALNAILSLPILFFVSLAMMPLKMVLLLFVGSVFGTMGFIYINKSLKILPVSILSPLTNFNPAVLAVLAFLILGERLALRQLFGIFIIMAGAYMLERMPVPAENKLAGGSAFLAFFFAFASAIFYGLSSIADKTVLSSISPLQYILLAHVFIAVNFALLSKRAKLRDAFALLSAKKGLFVASSLLTITYRLLQATAVALAPVSLVIPIRHLSSLVSTAVGGTLFHEKNLPAKLAIGAMMLAGTYFIIL